MPHSFYTAPDVVALGNALAAKDLVLAQTINRDYEANYGGGRGTTVNVRVPAALKARTRAIGATTAITTDNLTETTFPVTLDEHVYSAVDLSEAELNFRLEEFGRQVLKPQTDAVVDWIEEAVAAEMLSLAETNSPALGGYVVADPAKTFVTIRKALRDNGLPLTGLRAAVGTKVFSELVLAKAFSDSSESGQPSSIPNAEVRRVAGFDVMETNRIPEAQIVFYHRTAFTLAVRAPKVPDGVAFGASLASNGFALTHLMDYDSSTLVDRSIVHTFSGVQYIPARKIERSGTDATIVQVPSAYRLDTSTAPA